MKDSTEIVVVLDRSGSMECVRDDTIGGFNRFLEDQKKEPSPATFTLVQFDTVYEFVENAVQLKDAKPLNRETFVPRGGTALLDAIGRTINETGKRLADMAESDRPGKVVFVILTDGQENSSTEFSKPQINEMIARQRDIYSWQFVFLGANQDAIATAASMSIPAANALTYANNAVGTQAVYRSVANNMSSFRAGISGSMAFNDSDRSDQAIAGA